MSTAILGKNPVTDSVAQLLVNPLLDGQQGQTLTNFTIYLETLGIKGASHVEITNAVLANYVKPFHSLNQNIVYNYNGIYFATPINTAPYYQNPADLITAINTAINAVAPTVTFSLNPTTLRLNITEVGGNQFRMVGHFSGETNLPNRCNLKLGFIGYEQPTASNSTVSADIPLRIRPECIYVGTNLSFDAVQPSNFNLRNLLFRIPLTDTVGEIINFVPSTDQIFKLQLPVIESVTFSIYDDNFLNPNDLMEAPCQLEMHFAI